MGGVKGGELGAEHSGRIARGGEGVIISPCLAETESPSLRVSATENNLLASSQTKTFSMPFSRFQFQYFKWSRFDQNPLIFLKTQHSSLNVGYIFGEVPTAHNLR